MRFNAKHTEILYKSLSNRNVTYKIDELIRLSSGIYQGGSGSDMETELNLLMSIVYMVWSEMEITEVELYDLTHSEDRAPDIVIGDTKIECKRLPLFNLKGIEKVNKETILDKERMPAEFEKDKMINNKRDRYIQKSKGKADILIIINQLKGYIRQYHHPLYGYEDIVDISIYSTEYDKINKTTKITAEMHSIKLNRTLEFTIILHHIEVRQIEKDLGEEYIEEDVKDSFSIKELEICINNIRIKYIGINDINIKSRENIHGLFIDTGDKLLGYGNNAFIGVAITYLINTCRLQQDEIKVSNVITDNDINVRFKLDNFKRLTIEERDKLFSEAAKE